MNQRWWVVRSGSHEGACYLREWRAAPRLDRFHCRLDQAQLFSTELLAREKARRAEYVVQEIRIEDLTPIATPEFHPTHLYGLIRHPSGGWEVRDALNRIRKLCYNSGDICWMVDGVVVAVAPRQLCGRVIRYTDDDLSGVDSVMLPDRSDRLLTAIQQMRAKEPQAYSPRLQRIYWLAEQQ